MMNNAPDGPLEVRWCWWAIASRWTVQCLLTGLIVASLLPMASAAQGGRSTRVTTGGDVCPPFNLRDERGQIIDPRHGINANAPYSPKQTCGACHDYSKITQGYHFQQGRGEKPSAEMAQRYPWISSPGNYGGNWCSPAPLYRALAPKHNAKARQIDMTSFDFVTATCGNCHPGGGPLEYDRDGHRYDEWMRNPRSGLVPGGSNHLDGDYFRARWSQTGVVEADCLLCHLPEYDAKERNQQLAELNFRWAATAGAHLGKVAGSVKQGVRVSVTYDPKLFDDEGKVSLHLVREPGNATCLTCHAIPDWKKRGTAFTARTDVHIRAGLKCVDCHTAGSQASDPRIRGREVHQFGKGDDPSGHVRDDLDNTVRSCSDCHSNGTLGAPIATHRGLPPLHLRKLSCQTCHIPERLVKAAQVQVSDVFNPGPKIEPPAKHIWTFYDARMNYWNHYGELAMYTTQDEPTDPYPPVLAWYKDRIYPVNRVHSAWPGLWDPRTHRVDQPFMKDIYALWQAHRRDATRYPELSRIRDDNGDGIPEVNRPEEIDALIRSVRAYLADTHFDLGGKQVVWVCDDRVYLTGRQWIALPKHDFEASPYASVYEYSHDIAPARSALGVRGCTDCHSRSSRVFFASIVKYPFGTDARPVTEPQYYLLQTSGSLARLGAFREETLKPILYGLALLTLCLAAGALARWAVKPLPWARLAGGLTTAWALVLALLLLRRPDLRGYALPERQVLDSLHFPLALLIFAVAVAALLFEGRTSWPRRRSELSHYISNGLLYVSLTISAGCGLLMLLDLSALATLTRYAYTGFDAGLVLALCGVCLALIRVLTSPPSRRQSATQ